MKQADKGEILITTQPGKTENILIFKDTGPGMSQENVDQLFKPFFSKTKHGTGVGLSLCHNLMGAFGGRISCESVEGEFTEFKLVFPCLKQK